MNLAGYIRVSTEQQVDAYGKEVQQQSIQKWANKFGHTIVEWFEEDAVSGTKDSGDRPVLASIVIGRADEFDGIVMFDPTRIARRSVIQETLLNYIWEMGLRVYTTTTGELEADEEDPTKILMRQMLAVISEFEHRTIVRKLHAARRIKASQGGYIGGTARYGLRVEGTGKASAFVLDEMEQATINTVRQMAGVGLSMRQIAARLNAMGTPSKTGKTWHHQTVARLLEDPTH